MITIEDIQKLAELSRIKIAPSEQEDLRAQIESILGYIDQIKKVADGEGGVAGLVAEGAGEAGALRNVMREDMQPHDSGAYTERLIASAPAQEDNYVKVKKIL
jgi:aspartyl/glutamyl-tRNA(Asn/Gln) amidotransferase C subunit